MSDQSNDLNGMVAIAVGPAEVVTQWARLLRRAALPYYTAPVNWLGDDSEPCEMELWVSEAAACEARSVIRDARAPGALLIW